MSDPPLIDIHYLRPPDRVQIFTQHLIWEDAEVKITFSTDLTLDPPLRIDDVVVLETGSQVIWFTFPGAWHDIGLFHRADGTFTGTYANILTPCAFEEDGTWSTTDLFLDVWRDPAGRVQILDEDELAEAEERGWVTEDVAMRARVEAEALKQQAEAGLWPPPVVSEWSLAQARERLV
jgi:predicted RNA-binding protein associated with RNAse of E/G family